VSRLRSGALTEGLFPMVESRPSGRARWQGGTTKPDAQARAESLREVFAEFADLSHPCSDRQRTPRYCMVWSSAHSCSRQALVSDYKPVIEQMMSLALILTRSGYSQMGCRMGNYSLVVGGSTFSEVRRQS